MTLYKIILLHQTGIKIKPNLTINNIIKNIKLIIRTLICQ